MLTYQKFYLFNNVTGPGLKKQLNTWKINEVHKESKNKGNRKRQRDAEDLSSSPNKHYSEKIK